MEDNKRPQRHAGKSAMSSPLAAPLLAGIIILAIEIASFQSAQADTNYLASDTRKSSHGHV